MHADVTPLAPFSTHNGLHGVIGIDLLQLLCLASAVAGGIGFYLVERIRTKA